MSDDYVEGDINTIDDDEIIENDAAGNSSEGSLPEEVLVYLARSLTREPDAVVVESEERGNQVRLSLHVGPDDMGRVIGRRGRVFIDQDPTGQVWGGGRTVTMFEGVTV